MFVRLSVCVCERLFFSVWFEINRFVNNFYYGALIKETQKKKIEPNQRMEWICNSSSIVVAFRAFNTS